MVLRLLGLNGKNSNFDKIEFKNVIIVQYKLSYINDWYHFTCVFAFDQ